MRVLPVTGGMEATRARRLLCYFLPLVDFKPSEECVVQLSLLLNRGRTLVHVAVWARRTLVGSDPHSPSADPVGKYRGAYWHYQTHLEHLNQHFDARG